MGMLITLFAAAALAAAPEVAPAAATADGPVDFVAPDGSFAARFPGKPELVDGSWRSQTELGECGVMPIPMARDKDAATSEMVLNMMLAQLETSVAEKGVGKLVSSDQDAFQGKPARGFVLRSGPGDGAHSLSHGRLVRTDEHLVMVLCDSPGDKYDEAAVAGFVDSLRLPPLAK